MPNTMLTMEMRVRRRWLLGPARLVTRWALWVGVPARWAVAPFLWAMEHLRIEYRTGKRWQNAGSLDVRNTDPESGAV